PLNQEIIHFGVVGTGTVYKLMVNLMGAIQIASIAEGLVIAREGGLNLEQTVYALGKGQAASPQVVRNIRRMLADDHDRNVIFSGKLRLKDARYGYELAQSLGIDADFAKAAVEAYARLGDLGIDDQNESNVIYAIKTS
ncbi:MAG: NAD-binding protein, partial [Alphaproteobacteria bacterium]